MAPFARRRAQICVPAAFMRKVKRLKKSFARRLAVPVTPATFAVLAGRAVGPSAAGKSIRTCTGRPRTQLIYRRQALLPAALLIARAASKQASIAYTSPRELLGESDRSVAGLRDFAKRGGRACSEGSEGSGAGGGAHWQFSNTPSPRRRRRDGAERARSPAARDLR